VRLLCSKLSPAETIGNFHLGQLVLAGRTIEHPTVMKKPVEIVDNAKKNVSKDYPLGWF
jgi:hypothetical protein